MKNSYAVILKNYSQVRNKVLLFDQQAGIIDCYYTTTSKGVYLTSGSIISAEMVQRGQRYMLQYYELDYVQPLLDDRALMRLHDLVRFALQVFPHDVNLSEVFDFLHQVVRELYRLSDQDYLFVQCRLLWFVDALPAEPLLHQAALDHAFFKACADEQKSYIARVCHELWENSFIKP